VQVKKNGGAIKYDCKEHGIDIGYHPYILIPHPCIGSDVSENGDHTKICLGVESLIESIQHREKIILEKGKSNHLSDEQLEEIATTVFGLKRTDTICGYKIGTPPPAFNLPLAGKTLNDDAFAAGKAVRRTLDRLNIARSKKNSKFTLIGASLFILGVLGIAVLSLLSSLIGISFMPERVFLGSLSILGISVIFASNVFSGFFRDYPRNSSSRQEQARSPKPKSLQLSSAGHKIVLILAIAVVIGLVSFAAFSTGALKSSQRACVRAGTLNVRSDPTTQSEIVDTLPAGACVNVNIKSKDNSWVRIVGSKNDGKWIAAGFVEGVNLEDLNTFNEDKK